MKKTAMYYVAGGVVAGAVVMTIVIKKLPASNAFMVWLNQP